MRRIACTSEKASEAEILASPSDGRTGVEKAVADQADTCPPVRMEPAMIKPGVCLLALSFLSTAAFADPQRPPEYNQVATSFDRIESSADAQHARLTRVAQQKIALGNEAARLRAVDGGTLTSAHRDYLQRKLDRINGG
jgi:hypothetical protein